MKLVIVLVVGIVLYFIVSLIYKKFWHKGLNISVEFENEVVRVGEDNNLVEKISNDKVLPLPILQIRFAVSKTFKFSEVKKNSAVTDQMYRSDYFSVMPFQKVTRSYPFRCVDRGCFQLATIDVFGMDFFISKARRMTLKTPRLLYVLPKPIKDMNVPESIENVMNSIKEEGEDRKCIVLLNTELNSMSKADELVEDGIRIADYFVSRCYKDSIPIKFFTNGVDMLTGEECRLDAVSDVDDKISLEKTIARIDTSKQPRAFKHILAAAEKLDEGNTDFVIISNNRKSDFVKILAEFMEKGHSTRLIIPEFKNVDIAPYEDDKDKIVKWVVEND